MSRSAGFGIAAAACGANFAIRRVLLRMMIEFMVPIFLKVQRLKHPAEPRPVPSKTLAEEQSSTNSLQNKSASAGHAVVERAILAALHTAHVTLYRNPRREA